MQRGQNKKRGYFLTVIDLTKEYGLVFDGGGARGAYQIGAWKALVEAGVKVNAVAGTSVGALNGALVCMGDVAKAEHIWATMKFSRVMDVDDNWMERLFDRENTLGELLSEIGKKIAEGGVDITPLRELIHEAIDEKKIRESNIEFCLLTFSLSELKKLDLSIQDIPENLLEDFLLASAYLLGFKNEKLHGKTYLDGGIVNNVPLDSLVDRGYTDIIEVRIYGPGRERRVKLPDGVNVYQIIPRVKLGSILEFREKRSRQNLKIGYYDAKRLLYDLEGRIYYISETHEECYYEKKLENITDSQRAEILSMLRLSHKQTMKELYIAMLEASAKLMRVPKYEVYTVELLLEKVIERYGRYREQEQLPSFVHTLTLGGEDDRR